MQILYVTPAVERQFSSQYKKTWRYPKQVGIKLVAAESFIRKSNSFLDIASYPPFHLKRLKGKRKNEWSIRLGNTGYRVTMIPCDRDKEPILDGDILAKYETIQIVIITEVSNHYE